MRKSPKRRQPGLKFGALRLSWLETFVVASRSENRSVAAKKLGITQGAVTKHIQNLERWSQKILVYHDSVPMKLTEQGEAFVPVADNIVGVLAEARILPSAAQPLTRCGPPTPTRFMKIPGRRGG